MNDASRRSKYILIHSREQFTTTGERKGVQDGNTIPGSSISCPSYERGIREVTNNQLVTQTLVFPQCRLVRDFLIPELSYYKALLLLPRPFASLLLAIVVANKCIQVQSYYFTNDYVLRSSFIPYILPIIFVHKLLFTFPVLFPSFISSIIFHRGTILWIFLRDRKKIRYLNDHDIIQVLLNLNVKERSWKKKNYKNAAKNYVKMHENVDNVNRFFPEYTFALKRILERF